MPETSQLITSMELVFAHNNCRTVTITGMEPEFYRAAVAGEIDVFRVKSSYQIESMLTPNKNTILHIHLTCDKVSEAFVSKILNMCHALLKKVNAKHETILHIASKYGHLEIVKIIIECANKDAPSEDGKETLIKATNNKKDTALHEAVYYNHKEVVELLIKEDPNIGENNDGETPLYIAAERGYNEVIHTILEKSNSPNHRGPNGRTTLHAAIVHFEKLGKLETLKKLVLKIPSAIKEADENGWVPLHLAALETWRADDVAEVLLKQDRNTAYMRDNEGRTALHFAAYCGNDSVIKKILEYCPDCFELVDHKGRNALHYAGLDEKGILRSSWVANGILKEQLMNMQNEKDNDGNTPLHLLACHAPTWDLYYNDHPLLKKHRGVDSIAFNKKNQTAFDVAYDVVPSTSQEQNFFLGQLHKISAGFGGRVLNGDIKEKKKQKRHDSKVIEEQKLENKEKENLETLSRVRETSLVVATLIATVTFAAGFTVPGGTMQDGQNKGSPILMHNAAFKAFVITDSLSFVLSASAVLVQIFSSFFAGRTDFFSATMGEYHVSAALGLTTLGMVFMIVAFGTGTYAILGLSMALAVVTLLITLCFFFTFPLAHYLIRKGTEMFLSRRQLPRSHPELVSSLVGEDLQLLDSV
ncbi:uncharacterized protein LOC129284537 [Prosopis cineraria]|uniref:uncharacterized protein LOC129284537 n=1 Tax=Prosopis cineraria TaxID=364024 RepID=UPI00240F0A50|nr:uncharacterized protein LOC129284537 [Prosopis cineraria]